MPELIEHKKNGYIAEFKNIADLAEGIRFCCANSKELGEKARERVLKINGYDIVGKRYEMICKEALETQN